MPKYDMTIAPFNYTKAKGKWFNDGQVTYLRKLEPVEQFIRAIQNPELNDMWDEV